jgi:hypothetical protein
MPVYVDREAPKLWRRIYSEATLEASLLAEKWKLVLAGLVFQYIHGLAAHGVHYLHRPGPTLQDAGFFILPALGQDKAFFSETVFVTIFGSFILWTFHPFVSHSKKICTVLIWCRVFVYLALLYVSGFSKSEDHNILCNTASWAELSLSRRLQARQDSTSKECS